MSPARFLPLILGVLIALPGNARAADLVIGVSSWSSGVVTAHVLKAAIESEFGLDVDLREGSNEAIFAGMDDGSIDVHPEVWLPNHAEQSTEYVVRRRTVQMSNHGIPARQGLCVTRHTQEAYGVSSVTDLTDPEKAAIFDTAGDGRGEVWIGDTDWSSTRIERIRARSYGYDETMELLEADEVVAVTAIDAAVAVDKPLVFYCYEPHYVFELHDVVHLDEPPHDPRRWTIRDPASDPDWLENSLADVAWPVSFLHLHYAARLDEAMPEVAAFLASVRLDVDTVTEMTYAVVVDRRDPAEFAAEWVGENSGRVAAWREARR